MELEFNIYSYVCARLFFKASCSIAHNLSLDKIQRTRATKRDASDVLRLHWLRVDDVKDAAEREPGWARQGHDEVTDEVDGGHLHGPVELRGGATRDARLQQQQGEVLRVPERVVALARQVACNTPAVRHSLPGHREKKPRLFLQFFQYFHRVIFSNY